ITGRPTRLGSAGIRLLKKDRYAFEARQIPLRPKISFLIFTALVGCLAIQGCSAHRLAAKTETAAVLVGAGDIADCKDLSGAEATATLLDEIPGTVMAVGDLAYPDGTAANFDCYHKTWGRFKNRTRPAVGNHEFH